VRPSGHTITIGVRDTNFKSQPMNENGMKEN